MSPRPDYTFFTDRDLGKAVPRILRESGLAVERYHDHFADRGVPDNEWLQSVSRRGWVALSHDHNIRYDAEAIRSVMEYSGRLFILRGALVSSEMAAMFLEALGSVRELLGKHRDPFIAVVRRTPVKGGLFVSRAHPWLTLTEWKHGKIPGPGDDSIL